MVYVLQLQLSIYLSIFVSVYLVVFLFIYLSVYLSIYLPTYLPASLNTKLFCETSSIFELDNIKNETKSARLPQYSRLTTSKMKQFCETSFKNEKLSAELMASYQCGLRFFHSTCLKYCACHEKLMPGHTKCFTCRAKSSSQS